MPGCGGSAIIPVVIILLDYCRFNVENKYDVLLFYFILFFLSPSPPLACSGDSIKMFSSFLCVDTRQVCVCAKVNTSRLLLPLRPVLQRSLRMCIVVGQHPKICCTFLPRVFVEIIRLLAMGKIHTRINNIYKLLYL